ncbi:phosphoadenosine phosphosulfate reductase domain-containing protein [Geomonas ferrireducens]|uniref:phosphoadenosine phosphosulfate reductase domain-containing protein n=1 Tax=Geomonas ferrireducens TaxID=2570227 RepID=UPI0010A93C28|nr:phosphoadenosine phosphosulfate reductase family protein [Geomonas ferrireducens]
MYSYEWDKRTGRYRLTTQTGKFVASEIRPVFAEELTAMELEARLAFDPVERRPLLWAKQNVFLYRGEEIAKLHKKRNGKVDIEWKGVLCETEAPSTSVKPRTKLNLVPVDVEVLVAENRDIMSALVADTLKRIKEMYDAYAGKCDAVYIGFSCGKDSVVLLDLCHKVLPLDIPVVFSDTDMELPDTYSIWEQIQNLYKGRPFLKVSAKTPALENWRQFGPPSQALRWCCSVHKSTPAILALKERLGKRSINTLAFVGVRGEESQRRSGYEDIGDGLKSQSQVNAMPILAWSAHELWLYIFEHKLLLNEAYRKGLPRVGCLMCPMSTDRQNDLIRMNYPEKVAPFANAVRNTIDREFSSEEDADAFVYEGGWHARKSGVSLKHVIVEPGVERKSDRIICEYPIEAERALKEWLKALGKIEGTELSFREDGQRGVLECVWSNGKADKAVSKWLVYAVHKAMSCTGCNSCEAECPTGALRFEKDTCNGNTKVRIDDVTCISCMRCFAPDDGCWRYYSKRYAGAKTMNISGINKYMTFGLKPEWIEVLANAGANFRQTTALGNRMVPAAVTWFREAGLIGDSTAITTNLLLEVGKKRGFSDLLFWHLLWFRLANTSPLVKWYVCNTEIDVHFHMKEIDEKLSQSVGSASVRKGALQSLCQLVKSSPLGEGAEALIHAEMKGRAVEKLMHCSRPVDPLTVLYGLYVMAEKSGRGAFTVRQMMVTEFDVEVVSPLAAFGISPDDFKKQCMGLAAMHPDFIACSFTLGLDEVRVASGTKTCDDVVALILEKI